ncbi:MAG: hypothetical protein SGILL_010238 [Bacillariaceae sp.]
MSLSDVMCQELVAARSGATTMTTNKKKTATTSTSTASTTDLDYIRIAQVAITGFFWSGPITHVWYGMLERIYGYLSKNLLLHISASNNSPAVVAMMVKLFLDSILFSPTVVAGYFCVRSILEGSGFHGAKEKLKTKFLPTLFGAWKFWPLVNSVNFYFVPLQFQVLYMNVLSLLWSGYLTYVNSAKTPPPPQPKRV